MLPARRSCIIDMYVLTCCLGNSDVHLCIKVQSAGDGGAKVGEVVHHLKGMNVDGDGWQGVGA